MDVATATAAAIVAAPPIPSIIIKVLPVVAKRLPAFALKRAERISFNFDAADLLAAL